MRERIRTFMAGRCGLDHFGRFLSIPVIVLLAAHIFFAPIVFLALGLLVYQYYRIFSRDLYRRAAENKAYLNRRQKISGWIAAKRLRISQRDMYRFYRCPTCRQQLRVPRGKGTIAVTCPKCQTEFRRRS